MRQYPHLDGSHLPALEQNILKYRAMEMTLTLFYAEALRKLIISSIRTTASILSTHSPTTAERFPKGTRKPLQKALAFLVADGVFKESEKREIEHLIGYRNDIAHRVHCLTADIGHSAASIRYRAFRGLSVPLYDYTVLERFRYYRKIFLERARPLYVITISLAPSLFMSAEVTFVKELKRLHRKIIRQTAQRRRDIEKLKDDLSLAEGDVVDALQPYHPANQYESGKLTKRGTEVCYRFYDLERSPLVVAHLMGISLKAATNRKKLWQAAGGLERLRTDLTKIEMPPRTSTGRSGHSA